MKLNDTLALPLNASAWIGAAPTSAELAGRAVLLHFWSMHCPLCDEGMSYIAQWRQRYGANGLLFIAVFLPREDANVDRALIAHEARTRMGIDYWCAIDGDRTLERRFANPYAPGYLLFDRAHALRHRQMGNDGLEVLDARIERVLKASAPTRAY
jgi:thiol-disulfide isomerase/thioredoxin